MMRPDVRSLTGWLSLTALLSLVVAVPSPSRAARSGSDEIVVSPVHSLAAPQQTASFSSLLFTDVPLPGPPFGAYNTVAVADINGDGKLDVIRGGEAPNLEFLAGNGDGTFASGLAIPATLSDVVLVDMDGDGRLEIVGPGEKGFVYVLHGNGDGSFNPPNKYKAPGLNAAAGDLNGDGMPDIVVTGDGVAVLLANRGGGYKDRVRYVAGSGPRGVNIADLNGDGKPDLAVANFGGTISVLLGNGDGTFRPQISAILSGPGAQARDLAIADFNGDGKLDVAATQFSGSSIFVLPPGVHVLLGNGDGTFGPDTFYPLGSRNDLDRIVDAGDLNQDGIADLAVNFEGNTQEGVHVLLGNGDGTFTFEGSHAVSGNAFYVVIADVNSDGRPDLLTGGDALLNQGPALAPTARVAASGNATAFRLASASVSPNPLRAEARLSFTVVKTGRVSVRLFDASGRLARTIQDGAWTESGRHEVTFRRQGLAPGVYMYRIESSSGNTSGRLVIMD
jgi:hypothetical protein